MSGGTEQLLRHPDQFAALRSDPSAGCPNAVEEMLRWTSPVKNMCRTLTADTDFHGTHAASGEKIMLLFESANFDEQQFDDAGEVRHRAKPQQSHGLWVRHPLLPGQPAGPAGVDR